MRIKADERRTTGSWKNFLHMITDPLYSPMATGKACHAAPIRSVAAIALHHEWASNGQPRHAACFKCLISVRTGLLAQTLLMGWGEEH
jgi:hypothetical protein